MGWQNFVAAVFRAGQTTIINANGEFQYSGVPTLGNLYSSDTKTAGTDKYGNAYLAGKTTYIFVSGNFFALQQNGLSFTWYHTISAGGPWNADATLSELFSLTNDRLLLQNADFQLAPNQYVVASKPGGGPTFPEETWNAITPLNGWAVTSGGINHYRLGAEQFVFWAGNLNGGGATSGTIASVPSAYRPTSQQQWPCSCTAGGIAGQTPFLSMTVGGTLFVSGVTPGTAGMTITLGGFYPLGL